MKICLSCEGVTNAQAARCGHCGGWLLPTDSVHYPVRLGETDAGNPLLGTVIDGKYRLQSVLGRGGLGTVFSAMHIGSLMAVALKLLHPRFAGRPEYRRALLPEARRAATVTHTRCARLIDVGEAEEGVAYLAMELVEGRTLDVLMRGGKLAPSHALDILLQVAEALEAIHGAGLVHCDLSPRNVMVAVRGGQLQVKVLDFGIARSATLAGAEPKGGSEFTGFANPAFSAPEVLGGGKVDPRADLYSFGTLAWLLLTGSLPIEDTDPRRAALAVAAGDLRPWPRVHGVPRRLQRLVLQCMQRDPERRPASATYIRLQLESLRGARRPAIARAAIAAAAMVVVGFAFGESASPPFLELETGSDVKLVGPTEVLDASPQVLRREQLASLSFLFGGFDATRLRADVWQGGDVLARVALRPEVDAAAGALRLSREQAQWREVLHCLTSSSDKGPVDIKFVVPGAALLGTARVRVDDTAPRLSAQLTEVENGVIVGRSLLEWRGSDENGLASCRVDVVFADQSQLQLPLEGLSGSFGLGKAIAAARESVGNLGGGTLVVSARDFAGNEAKLAPIVFEQADVGVPMVVEVTGPSGESFVPWSGDQARLRVRLSALEPNCNLLLYTVDGALLKTLPLSPTELSQTFVVPPPATNGSVGALDFHVVDAFTNRSTKQHGLHWRDQTVRLAFAPDGPGVCQVGRELVLAVAGGAVAASAGENMAVVRAALELTTAQGSRDAGVELRCKPAADGTCRLEFGTLPPGSHVLRCQLQEREVVPAVEISHEVPVRVLPASIDVRIPPSRSRFLRDLVDSGVLAFRSATESYGEGAWFVDPSLVPYLRGTLWVGADSKVSLPLPVRQSATEPLLPGVTPVSGHNVLALDLRDVLDRPVRLLAGDGVVEQRHHEGQAISVIADFWFNEKRPERLVEELIGEHGQPVRLRLRFPLPFLSSELGSLQLSIAQSTVQAAEVERAGDTSVVAFDLQFEHWSVAAGLLGKTREDFAEQLVREFKVKIETPAGQYEDEVIRVRTTRSNLQPVRLAELGGLEPLASIRLVPLLAPGQPFEEPVPPDAPPRSVFRPQEAVAVKNFADILLQDREISCGEARALLAQLELVVSLGTPRRFVHDADPLGKARLSAGNLLPEHAVKAPGDELLSGVNFYQAWTLCRLLGHALAGDPELFRLPLGCELELAAFGSASRRACHGVAAHGGAVDMQAFVAAARILARGAAPTAEDTRAAGDRIPTAYGVDILGLDFGVREWVLDLPNVTGAEGLIAEWIKDLSTHLEKAEALADGRWTSPTDLIGDLRRFGVVRGLALGEREGLVRRDGSRLEHGSTSSVPDTVPGCLRTEQLLRDGSGLLSHGGDPRLARTGFRVVAAAAALARLRGRR
ncbi:MAG TPA: serine/threonine-protein kinase [Planctomycetota bacterium]